MNWDSSPKLPLLLDTTYLRCSHFEASGQQKKRETMQWMDLPWRHSDNTTLSTGNIIINMLFFVYLCACNGHSNE